MEKIIYHEWHKDPYEYNEGGIGLTDNWNPDVDYGNEYVNVYFRVKTPGFDWRNGSFENKESAEIWSTEAEKIISEFGYINGTEYSTRNTDNKAHLYPHPQSFSGEIPKNDVKRVAERIAKSEFFKIEHVDLYSTIYVISDEEYEKYLDGKAEQIQETIFNLSRTKRTTLFCNTWDIAYSVAEKFRLRRLGLNDGRNYGSGQTIDYTLKIIDKMIENGLLIPMAKNDREYIRSLNKTEQRQKFKKLLYV